MRRLDCLVLVALVLVTGACGDEPTVVVEWPDMAGAFQYRAFMPVDADGLVCVEHGDLAIDHPGEDAFTAAADLTLDCWVGDDRIATPSGPVTFTNGVFGDQLPKGSWPMTWDGRPGWTYRGEVFWATDDHMLARGTGTAVIELPGGEEVDRTFTWTICRRFFVQNDPVEQECDYFS